MPRLDRRDLIPWIVTSSIVGSLIAIFIDLTKQNPWLLLYEGFVLGWLLVLTSIVVVHFKSERK
jgi:hypothetical protein